MYQKHGSRKYYATEEAYHLLAILWCTHGERNIRWLCQDQTHPKCYHEQEGRINFHLLPHDHS